MSIKSRFKKALFAFFKDEILEAVGYTSGWHQKPIVVDNSPFDVIKTSYVLDLQDHQRSPVNAPSILEEEIAKAKRVFVEKIVENIEVEQHNLLRPEYYMARGITLSITIKKK